MANIKKLDVLNSEGPVILAVREPGRPLIQLKFDAGGAIKVTNEQFYDFIYGGSKIVNPLNERDEYIFMNFSSDMRATEEKIAAFLAD